MIYSHALEKRDKQNAIQNLIAIPSCNIIDELKINCILRYGLLNKENRQIIWPLLFSSDTELSSFNDYKSHAYYNQVFMDIERTLKRFPPGLNQDEKFIIQKKALDIIMNVLIDHRLHYYQGYHDIALTLLLVVDEYSANVILQNISNLIIKDFMESSMDKTNQDLAYIYPILSKIDPELALYLENSALNPPIFCLSHLITWFSRALGNNVQALARVYEYFMAIGEIIMPLYLCACFIATRLKERLFECEGDMPTMHTLLSNDLGSGWGLLDDFNQKNLAELPKSVIAEEGGDSHNCSDTEFKSIDNNSIDNCMNEEDLEDLLEMASSLYLRYPPKSLDHDRIAYLKRCSDRDAEEKRLNDERKKAYEGRKMLHRKALLKNSLKLRVYDKLTHFKPMVLLNRSTYNKFQMWKLHSQNFKLLLPPHFYNLFDNIISRNRNNLNYSTMIIFGVSLFVALMAITLYIYLITNSNLGHHNNLLDSVGKSINNNFKLSLTDNISSTSTTVLKTNDSHMNHTFLLKSTSEEL